MNAGGGRFYPADGEVGYAAPFYDDNTFTPNYVERGQGRGAVCFDYDEGFLMEILDDGRAIVYWFTYEAEGGQDWFIAIGNVQGTRAVFPQLLRVSGGVFGPDFNPDTVEVPAWSSLVLDIDCNGGTYLRKSK